MARNKKLKYSKRVVEEVFKLLAEMPVRRVSQISGVPERTVRHWKNTQKATVKMYDEVETAPEPDSDATKILLLEQQARDLRAALAKQNKNTVTEERIRSEIFKLANAPVAAPDWVSARASGYMGEEPISIPTLFASDWHWGEVVHASQVGGCNEYNLDIAHRRAKTMIEKTKMLLRGYLGQHVYPGIVFALGGDMVSGDIHEELSVSNELEIMPTVVDIVGVLIWCIDQLAGEFDNVFVPCVTGNHGRNTKKIRAKGRNHTSFDWLIYMMLAKHFEHYDNVTFMIPDGPDARYTVYNHTYLLTHGDQFRGGDGMIGPIGPIFRGDHKKRSRNRAIGMEYDTMMIGHFHTLIQLERLIVNSSLKGYDEYAYAGNFGFEPPRQALWLTHPEHGITFSAPVLVDDYGTDNEEKGKDRNTNSTITW